MDENWTDYLGNSPTMDYAVDSAGRGDVAGVVVPRLEYLGFQAERDLVDNNAVSYNHGDLVGSTMYRATFDQQGQPTATQQVTYTAFGEPVVADGGGGWTVGGELPIGMGRYGYVGGHGYESGMIALYGENEALPAVMLVHVGERWYEPGTGRFVQRDPIGLRGGLNVYGYCGGQPLVCVDPSGLVWDYLIGGDTVRGGGWSGFFLNLTGGRNSWLDNPRTRRRVQSALAAPAGFVAVCIASPMVGSALVYGAGAWGGYRIFLGGSTGDADVDAILDGAAIGAGLGRAKRGKTPGSNPSNPRGHWDPITGGFWY